MTPQPLGAVYRALDIRSNRSFVAQTKVSLRYEIHQHYLAAQKLRETGFSDAEPFHILLLQLGVDYFRWEILEECGTQGELDNAERRARDFYSANGGLLNSDRKLGMFGRQHTPQSIALMRRVFLNRPPLSLEARKKISLALTGVPQSKSHIRKRAEALRVNMTEEKKAYLREKNVGQTRSEETRRKMAKSQLRNTNACGQIWSDERRRVFGERSSAMWAKKRMDRSQE